MGETSFQGEEQKEERSFRFQTKQDSNNSSSHPNTFPASERLKSIKFIRDLFVTGERVHSYPITLIWTKLDSKLDVPVKVGFTVPKKNFRKAVKRNRIKRQMREAYRLHRLAFLSDVSEAHTYIMMFIYSAPNPLPYDQIENKVISCCKALSKKIK